MTVTSRPEGPADAPAIAALVTAAFRDAPHSDGTEAAIVERLRRDGGFLLSLVAEEAGAPVGHVSASPARIGGATGWACIAPLAVSPERQGWGIGGSLLQAALRMLRAAGGEGALIVGDPGYYARFGFAARDGLTAAGVPDAYVLALPFADAQPRGEAAFHPAFGLG